jgi:hypothetical protein
MDAAALARKVKQFAGDRDSRKLGKVIDRIMELETAKDLNRLIELI